MLSETVEKHAPLKRKYVKKPAPVFMNSELRKAIHRKHYLRNKFQKGKISWSAYRIQTNLVCILTEKVHENIL